MAQPMDKWLGPEGPFATGLNRYEQRPGQVAMANAVEKAFTDDGILLCEAPTGTGKTSPIFFRLCSANDVS